MDTQKTHSERVGSSYSPPAAQPAMASCRKKKTTAEGGSFIAEVRDHIDEFIHASVDEHKTCFQKTIRKMFGMSKVVAERSSEANKEVESVLRLKTALSD